MIKKIKKLVRLLIPKFYNKLVQNKRNIILKKFKKDYPNIIIFEPINKEDRKLYSQDNQDYIVYNNFFRDKTDGVFCDVGGNHPLSINNTLYFEELGWNGYVFEPLPHMKPLWNKHRKAKLFPYAASDSEGEVTFSVVKDTTGWEDMLSFVKETRDENYGHETEDITVQTRMLKNVFKEENITYIDYMSIDVEGHELNVIKGIDFNVVRINVLTIENNSPCCSIYGDENIRKLMFDNDYILWGRIVGLDDIFVHKDFINKI